MDENKKLKFIFTRESLDFNGKVREIVETKEVDWINYDPNKIMNEVIISGDFKNLPKPFAEKYSTDFMERYAGQGYFDFKDFNRYKSVESEVVEGNIKFVVYDRIHEKMSWVEA